MLAGDGKTIVVILLARTNFNGINEIAPISLRFVEKLLIPGSKQNRNIMENHFPQKHQQLMPYLVIEDADAFIAFVLKIFDGRELMNFKADGKTTAHAEIAIGNSILMLSGDTQMLKPCTGGLFSYVQDVDATFEEAVKNGAISIMAVKESPFGRSGGFRDPFGNIWWIKTYRDRK